MVDLGFRGAWVAGVRPWGLFSGRHRANRSLNRLYEGYYKGFGDWGLGCRVQGLKGLLGFSLFRHIGFRVSGSSYMHLRGKYAANPKA